MDALSSQSDAWSLLTSLLEPNWLILCSYLALNVFLTCTVLNLARVSEALDPSSTSDTTALGKLGHKPVSEKGKIEAPLATVFVRVSTWAFKADARNAKRVVALLAMASLASTWYYMFAFLHHSYIGFIDRCHLSGCQLPPLAPNLDLAHPSSILPALHLSVSRISQWLASISLFKEAWMEVIKDPLTWWWSSEICLITVGPWALFLYYEARRLDIKHVWACMALGQLVAISFAFNLFSLAVVYRLAMPLVTSVSIRARGHVPQPVPDNTKKLVTTVRVRRVNLPRQHSWSALVPDTVGLAVLTAAGLSSVLQHPNSFTKVMVMHVFPMLIVLYPRSMAADSIFGRHVSVSPKSLYLLLGAVSVYLRVELSYSCFQLVGSLDTSYAETAKSLVHALFPTTFLQHPAQSSISSDHVSVAISTLGFIGIESGVWLWKLAIASPSALPAIDSNTPDSGTVYLDKGDRDALEGQAVMLTMLLALSPILGASATLSFYLALRSDWVERCERHESEGHLRDVEQERVLTLLSKETSREIIQTEHGDRVLITQETKVAHYCPP